MKESSPSSTTATLLEQNTTLTASSTMQYTTLITLGLIGLATAAPNGTPLKARDEFVRCAAQGDNCATDGNRFCDDTGRYSVCHNFGVDCWIQHTAQVCEISTRTAQDQLDDLLKRDEMNKCSTFGDKCKTDNNEFCDAKTGKLSICHRVPFSNECWIKYTQESCKGEPKPAEHDDDDHDHDDDDHDDDDHDHDDDDHDHDGINGDRFEKCKVFGEGCNEDGNDFCYEGLKSTCHHVPFSNGESHTPGKIIFVHHSNFATECYLQVSREAC